MDLPQIDYQSWFEAEVSDYLQKQFVHQIDVSLENLKRWLCKITNPLGPYVYWKTKYLT